MEITEIASAQIAVPVCTVIVGAFLVFLFGFKSPVQPPSFDFEDERKQNQRKGKKVKSKPVPSGHTAAVPVLEDSSPRSLSPKPGKQTATPKANRAENRPQPPKAELKKDKFQSKKETKEVVKDKAAKAKVAVEDDGEWEVQRSRKDKKSKPKKEEGAAVGEEAKKADAAPYELKAAEDMEPESASAAGEPKTKKKKKPSKAKQAEDLKVEAAGGDNSNNSAAAAAASATAAAAPVTNMEVKSQPADSEDSEVAQMKKTKKKKDKKLAGSGEEGAVEAPKLAEPAPTPVPPVTQPATPAPVPSSSETETKSGKSPKKKKNKEAVSASASTAPQHNKSAKDEAIKPAEASKPAEAPSPKTGKKSAEKNKPAASEAEAPAAAAPTITKAEAAAVEPVNFDELGGSSDPWIEAPKSKKKKARREN